MGVAQGVSGDNRDNKAVHEFVTEQYNLCSHHFTPHCPWTLGLFDPVNHEVARSGAVPGGGGPCLP